jgi:2'-5' RNA ligase
MNWYKKAKKEECKGWIAVRLPERLSNEIKSWGKDNIPNSILCKEEGKGRESDIHVTVIYGVCDNSVEAVRDIAQKYQNIKVKLGKVGYFKNNEDFDVVKIEIISEDLRKIHEDIKRTLDVEETHDVYKPHCTIAYVEKGESYQFGGNDFMEGEEIAFDKIVFINNKDEETEIKL